MYKITVNGKATDLIYYGNVYTVAAGYVTRHKRKQTGAVIAILDYKTGEVLATFETA